MKNFLLVLFALSFSPVVHSAPIHSKEFCLDMGGMSVIMGQYRDKGLKYIQATMALQNFLDDHPEFPATELEKEYALTIIKTIYANPGLHGNNLGTFVYEQCMAEVDL